MKQLILFALHPEAVVLPNVDSTTYVHFESVDPEENRFRFYTITWQKTLWDEWTILTTWGRKGGLGRSKATYFESEQALRGELPAIVAHRLKRGYEVRGVADSTVRQPSSQAESRGYEHEVVTLRPIACRDKCTA